jgi:transposase-like protein
MSIKGEEIIETGRRRRRRHSAQFKAEAVQACQVPGVSVAAVALARGLNANLLRSWIKLAERAKTVIAIQPSKSTAAVQVDETFVPVTLPRAGPTESVIRIEVRRKDRRVSIEWPASAAQACAVMLHEILK